MPWFNDCEGGTVGSAPPTTNDGSGDPWTVVQDGGVAGFNDYSTDFAAHGTKSIKFATRGTAESEFVAWDFGTPFTGSCFGRCYAYWTGFGTSCKFINWRVADAALVLGYLQVSAAGVVQLRNGPDNTTAWTGPTLSAAQWYRFEWMVDPTGATADSTINIHVYNYDDATVVAGGDSGDVSGVTNNGPANTNIQYVRYGPSTTLINVPSTTDFLYMDDFAAFDTTRIGAAVTPGPATRQPGRVVRGWF